MVSAGSLLIVAPVSMVLFSERNDVEGMVRRSLRRAGADIDELTEPLSFPRTPFALTHLNSHDSARRSMW